MRNPFRVTDAGRDVPTTAITPVFANRVAQWRVFMFWTRVVCWALVGVEYVSPLTGRLQADEAVVLAVAVAALFGGRRRWPMLVMVELFAVAYLVLEEPSHYMPVALCLLVAGHAAFTTKVPYAVLFGIGCAGLWLGYIDGLYPPSMLVRNVMIVGVALFGSRLFRLWVEDLAADVGRGFNDLLDRGFSVYPSFVDFATQTTSTLDSLIDNEPIVEQLRDRINELETATAAAQAALSIADHADEELVVVDLQQLPLPSSSLVRPHCLTRATGRHN